MAAVNKRHQNILKRLLVHAGAFNLGLILRHLTGWGTPRGLRGRRGALAGLVTALIGLLADRWTCLPGTESLPVPAPTYSTDDLTAALLA